MAWRIDVESEIAHAESLAADCEEYAGFWGDKVRMQTNPRYRPAMRRVAKGYASAAERLHSVKGAWQEILALEGEGQDNATRKNPDTEGNQS
jgi:hypothetical protein